MLALERRNLILEKLQTEKRVVVSELSQLYEVSEETIRRDLDKLEKEGLATKSYGGAVIKEDVSIDLPFNIRKNQNVGGKQKMAELAASLVKEGDHIFLDASTLSSCVDILTATEVYAFLVATSKLTRKAPSITCTAIGFPSGPQTAITAFLPRRSASCSIFSIRRFALSREILP